MSSLTTDVHLSELKAQALRAFSLKDYTSASDLYAKACELQSSIIGENNPKNGHLLHSYGRSLYEVALKRSDVLGGAPAQDDKKQKKRGQDLTERGEEAPAGGLAVIEESEENPAAKAVKAGFFSITGDENWGTDDDEVETDEDEQGGEGEGEGFALAWEILDLARVMFLKQLATSATEGKVEEPTESTTPNGEANKDSAPAPTPLDEEEIKRIKTALADTYDLLGEVSLESESFVQAAKDLRSSLDLKLELYPVHSTLITEAHFKLSLALEFSAAGEQVSADDSKKGREDAAIEMEKAIKSCKARIAKEEADISVENDSKSKEEEVSTKSLDEARELVGESSDKNDSKSKGEEVSTKSLEEAKELVGEPSISKGKGKEISTKSLDEAREMVAELEVRVSARLSLWWGFSLLMIYDSLPI
jgi:HAT1-interacting factor 1